MVPLAHARWSADRRAVVTPEAGDQHRVVDRRGDRRGRAAHLSARRVDGRRRVDVEVRADPARHARGRNGEGVGSWVRRGRPGDLPVRRDRDILSVVGGVDDQRPARGGRDRRRARAGVRGDRRHHDVVGERARGPADGERRGAAGTAAAGARRAAEPDARRSRAGFRRITLVDRRAAHGPRVPRRVRARRARAAAHVGGARIAVVGARGPVRLEGVGRTRGARPGAVLGYGARARRGAADRARRQEAVGGTGGARPGALLRGIAHVDGGPTDRARRQECVGRTGCAGAGAALGHVARTGCGAAHGARVPRRVRAGYVGTIALIQGAGVGVGRAGSAGRLLGVRRTGGGDPVAGLRQVALARRRAADRPRGLGGVSRAGDAGAGAGLGHVTGACRGAADDAGDRDGVGRTGDARAGALLGHIARPGGGAANEAGGLEAVGGTGSARPGALLRGIAHVDGGPTDRARRQECVGRAGGARAGTVLGHVADARRGAAFGAGGQEEVGRTGRARAGAGLGHVARPGCGAAHGARVPRRVLAGGARAVAHVEGAGVGVGRAGGAGRLHGVGRAVCAGAVACLGRVTGACRCAADGPLVPRRVRAGAAATVAHVQGAGVGVGRAGGAGCLLAGVLRARRAGAGAVHGQIALTERCAAEPGARPEAAGGRAAGACYSVRRPQIAVLARVHEAVAAIRIRRVGGDVRYPIPGRAQRAGGVVGVGGGYDLVLRVEGEGASPIHAHPREACVGAAVAVVAGREDVTFETVGADGADEKLDRLGRGGGGTGVRRGASTVAGTGLIARARLGEARELVSGE